MRLLLVDDDSALRALLRTTFEAVSVDVDEAGDAREAAERIAEAPPEVAAKVAAENQKEPKDHKEHAGVG